LVLIAGWAAPDEASCKEAKNKTDPLTINTEHAALMTLFGLTFCTLVSRAQLCVDHVRTNDFSGIPDGLHRSRADG
jgi:hypothetical protein